MVSRYHRRLFIVESSLFADNTATCTIHVTPLERENLLPLCVLASHDAEGLERRWVFLCSAGRDGSLEAGIRVSGGLTCADCHARDPTSITSLSRGICKPAFVWTSAALITDI